MENLEEHLVHITQADDRRQLGLWLHDAETTIGVGRRAIRELRTQEPIDETAIEEWKADIEWSRLARNALRRRLEVVPPSHKYQSVWLR